MKVSELSNYLESIAPLAYQESYDNSGLIVGDKDMPVKKVLISLDCTEDVVDEAIEIGANVIVSHHPIVFSGLKKFNGKNYVERVVMKAIKNDIALYAIHTNLDNVSHGVNLKITEKLGLRNAKVLDPKRSLLSKLITFAPHEHAGRIRDHIFAAGAGHIGNYSECSFNAEGYGTFKGNDNSNAFVGEKNITHTEPETRIEVMFPSRLESTIINALKDVHPYEEVAYYVVNLNNEHQEVGSGMIAEFEEAISEIDFLKLLTETFNVPVVRHTALMNKSIKKVAVCGGSGSFLLNSAQKHGADAFVTADYKYHQFFDAEGKILICDVGHYESEQFTMELLLEKIQKKFPTFAVCLTKCNTNSVHYFKG
jgi:dinuclear metal center YbgI/SA1388 family protein